MIQKIPNLKLVLPRRIIPIQFITFDSIMESVNTPMKMLCIDSKISAIDDSQPLLCTSESAEESTMFASCSSTKN